VYWTRKNEAENAEFSKITSRKQNLKAARNEKLSSRRSANSPMPSGCAIPILKPGVFQQNLQSHISWRDQPRWVSVHLSPRLFVRIHCFDGIISTRMW